MVGVHPAGAAGVLFAEKRSRLTRYRAGAVLQALMPSGARADTAATIEMTKTHGACWLAACVVLCAMLTAGTVEITAAGMRPVMARAVVTAFPAVWTIGILTALPLGGAVAIAIDAALLVRGAASVVLRAILAWARAAELFAVAEAHATGVVAAHRGGVVTTVCAASSTAAGAPHWRFGRLRGRNRSRW